MEVLKVPNEAAQVGNSTQINSTTAPTTPSLKSEITSCQGPACPISPCCQWIASTFQSLWQWVVSLFCTDEVAPPPQTQQTETSREQEAIKEKSPELFAFYEKQNLFADPSRPIKVDIQSFEGKYGIKLDEVGIHKTFNPGCSMIVSLTRYIDQLDANVYDWGIDHRLTFRECFQFLVNYINHKIELNSQDPSKKAIDQKRMLQLSTHPIYLASDGISFSNQEVVKHITPAAHRSNISWFDVACTILKEEGHIQSFARNGVVIFKIQA